MRKVKRGQIYYADLSPVVGSEQDGFRPILILQNDTDNKFSPTTIVAPITSTKPDSRMPTHVRVNVEDWSADLSLSSSGSEPSISADLTITSENSIKIRWARSTTSLLPALA